MSLIVLSAIFARLYLVPELGSQTVPSAHASTQINEALKPGKETADGPAEQRLGGMGRASTQRPALLVTHKDYPLIGRLRW